MPPLLTAWQARVLLRNGFPVWQSDTTLVGLNSWVLPTQRVLAHRKNSAEPRDLRIDAIKKKRPPRRPDGGFCQNGTDGEAAEGAILCILLGLGLDLGVELFLILKPLPLDFVGLENQA